MTETDKITELLESTVLQEKMFKKFGDLMTDADEISDIICKAIEQQALNQKVKGLDTVILGLARSLTYFTRLSYDNDESFIKDLEKARDVTYERVTLAIDNPQRCGECAQCLANQGCDNPILDDQIEFQMLPMISCSLIEYGYWCQMMASESEVEINEKGE